jgi:hypothetical protein
MKNFHVSLLVYKDTTIFNFYVTGLPDSLLWQIENILQSDIQSITSTINTITWQHQFGLSKTISDESLCAVIGLLRSNGYRDVQYSGSRYESLQRKSYCILRKETRKS